MFLGAEGTVSLSKISKIFFLRTSVLKIKALFRGLQPRPVIVCRLEGTCAKTDISPLCNRAFANSFAQVPSNRHSISDRDWNPLNRALIFNTEVLKTNIVDIVDNDTVLADPRNIFTGDKSVISYISSTSSVASTSTATCRRVTQTLNLTSGLAGTIINDMLQYALKEEGVNDNLKKRYAEGKILRGEIFEGKKTVTAGLLFKASPLCLDNNVLN